MRKSKVLRKLRNGEFVSCFKLNLTDPRAVEIAALAGFDCLWVDQEHIGQDWSDLAAGIWAAKSQNTDIVVRVQCGSYNDYIKPLELDATGIMVPHVMGAEEARQVVRYTRFHPVGRRPMDGGNADGAYSTMDFTEYILEANKERFVILQIEDPEPMKELEDIAALEGYDMLFFGPGDYSQGIGHPGQWDHPDIEKARIKIAEVANRHGKYAGTVGSVADLDKLKQLGYHFVSVGADVVGLTQYCIQIKNAFDDRSGDKKISKAYFEG